jgi:hypothetical protein
MSNVSATLPLVRDPWRTSRLGAVVGRAVGVGRMVGRGVLVGRADGVIRGVGRGGSVGCGVADRGAVDPAVGLGPGVGALLGAADGHAEDTAAVAVGATGDAEGTADGTEAPPHPRTAIATDAVANTPTSRPGRPVAAWAEWPACSGATALPDSSIGRHAVARWGEEGMPVMVAHRRRNHRGVIGPWSAVGAGTGLLFALLIGADLPLGLVFGATIGLLVGLAADAFGGPDRGDSDGAIRHPLVRP